MLQKIRKFSSTMAAKILLAVVILPFVMWGMGDVFRQGDKNIVATINKEKISVEEFINHLNSLNIDLEEISKKNPNFINEALNNFISKKIIFLESSFFKINISKNSLAKIIKNEKNFLKDGDFSRTKYEKFLIKNNLNTLQFENSVKKEEELKMFFEYIGGGVLSPDFLIQKIYNQKNQTRDIEVIDLNKVYNKNFNITDEKITEYFKKNSDNFKKNYKQIKYLEINPQNLIGQSEYNNLFFQKLDKIEDLIADNFTVDLIAQEFNLKVNVSNFLNKEGKNENDDLVVNFNKKLLSQIFQITEIRSPNLLDYKDDYVLLEVLSDKNILPNINSGNIKKTISNILKAEFILEHNNKLLSKIKKDEFLKYNFDKFAEENSAKKEKLKLRNVNDKQLDPILMKKVYKMPLNKINLVRNDNFTQNLLVYIVEINNKTIGNYDENYKDYLYEANRKMMTNIYNSYDNYVAQKYNFEINYQALENIKNYYK